MEEMEEMEEMEQTVDSTRNEKENNKTYLRSDESLSGDSSSYRFYLNT